MTIVSDPNTTNGSVSGWVVAYEDQSPIPDAELTFEAGSTIQVSRTDSSGTFSFVPAGPADFVLVGVTAKGFQPRLWSTAGPRPHFSLVPGSRTNGVRIEMWPYRICAGRTVFEDGGGAAGARVFTDMARSNVSINIEDFETVSADGGWFSLPCEEFVALQASLGDLHTAGLDLAALSEGSGPEGARRLVLSPVVSLPPSPVMIRGRVAGVDGSPVREVSVGAGGRLTFSDGGTEVYSLVGDTDEHGAFNIGVPFAGQWRVAAFQGSFRGPEQLVTAPTSSILLLLPTGAVEVRATQVDGGHLPLFEATVGQPTNFGFSLTEGQLRIGGGAARLEQLPAGKYDVRVVARGYVTWNSSIDVAVGTVAQVDAKLERGTLVHGRVVDSRNRRPLVGVTVRLLVDPREQESLGGFGATQDFVTDLGGEFSIEGVTPGAQLLFLAEGYASTEQRWPFRPSLEVEMPEK